MLVVCMTLACMPACYEYQVGPDGCWAGPQGCRAGPVIRMVCGIVGKSLSFVLIVYISNVFQVYLVPRGRVQHDCIASTSVPHFLINYVLW